MKAFVVNAARCMGCMSCQISCKDEYWENDWSPYSKPQPDVGQFWMKVQDKERGSVPVVRVSYLPVMCQHCQDAPCANACEADAFERRDDGLLLLNPDKCNGCMKCVEACPVGAIYPNADLGIAQKCTGCAHLLDNGWTVPRCVEACSTEALYFGEEEELADMIAKSVFLPEVEGNAPMVYYMNLPKRFVAGEVVDLRNQEVIIGAGVELVLDGETVAALNTDDFGDFFFDQVEAADYEVKITLSNGAVTTAAADVILKDLNIGVIDVSDIC